MSMLPDLTNATAFEIREDNNAQYEIITLPAAAFVGNQLPADLAAAATTGVSQFAAREDHVHKRPTAVEIGALPKGLAVAKGDILVATGPNTFARLPIGAEGQVLAVVGANPAGVGWLTLGAAASGSDIYSDIYSDTY